MSYHVGKVQINSSLDWFNRTLTNPAQSIAFDQIKNLIYVVDTGGDRIQKFDDGGNYQGGTSDIENGEFSNPMGIAVDKEGYIYVADKGNNRIQTFDADGNFLTQWGSAINTNDGKLVVINTDPASSDNTSTLSPDDIAVYVDPANTYRIAYVTDETNERIYAFKWFFSKPSISLSCADDKGNIDSSFDFSKYFF